MKKLIQASLVFIGLADAQDLPLPNSVSQMIPEVWKEKPTEIQLDLSGLKLGTMGYRIESTDFEADPDRQLVVILKGTGGGFTIVEVRGRYLNQKKIEEWSIFYHKGAPLLAQVKRWNKAAIEDVELGETLIGIETFLADDGEFGIEEEDVGERIMDMQTFADNEKKKQNKPAMATPDPP